MDKTWDNFKKYFIEAYLEIKEDNELNKKHLGFLADKTKDQPHVEESHMADTMKNVSNTITSGATKLNNLTTENTKLV